MDGKESPGGEGEAVARIVEFVQYQTIAQRVAAEIRTQFDFLDPVNRAGFGQLISPFGNASGKPVVDAQDKLTILEHELAKAWSMAWRRHVPILNPGCFEPRSAKRFWPLSLIVSADELRHNRALLNSWVKEFLLSSSRFSCVLQNIDANPKWEFNGSTLALTWPLPPGEEIASCVADSLLREVLTEVQVIQTKLEPNM